MLLYGMTQEGAATRIEKLSFLLGSVFGMCTTIIISYFTSSTVTDYSDTKFRSTGDAVEAPKAPAAPNPHAGA